MTKTKDFVILAVETATSVCAAALLRGGEVKSEISKITQRRHNETLPEIVDTVLSDAGSKASDIDAIAVSIGPGSFTGLRVGLSFAKGLALAVGAEIIPVATLDSLASGLLDSVKEISWINADILTYCPMTIARREEVFCKIFKIVAGKLKTEKEAFLGNADQITRQLVAGAVIAGEGADMIGDELLKSAQSKFLNLSETGEQIAGYQEKCLIFPEHLANPVNVGLLAHEKWIDDLESIQPANELEPLYLKEFTIRIK